MTKDGLEGFATQRELEAYRAAPGAFRLGRLHEEHGETFEAGIFDDRHLFIVAGSRGGKGTTMIVPNLIHWRGGMVCIDPKGENASITAMRRGAEAAAANSGTEVGRGRFLGQKVAILDPFGTVRGPARMYRTVYDPLGDIEIGSDDEASQILAVAEALVLAEKGNGSHFSESAETILAGLIEAILHTENPAGRTLSTCRDVAISGMIGLKAYLEASPETDAGLAEDAFTLLDSVGEEEGGSFVSTLSRQIKWLADPRMRRHLRAGDFSLVRAMRENWSVYICIPPSRIPGMRRWLRAIVRVALDAKMNSPLAHRGQQTLFMLDEFYALGHMQLIEDAAAYMAGYGIKLVPVIQNIGQVQKLYDKNWETFLGNAGGIIAWALNDLETEKYISNRMGQVMGWEHAYSESRSKPATELMATNLSLSDNVSLRERAIRWPSEIHIQGARPEMRAFVIPADGAPFMVRRMAYMEGGAHGLFDSPDGIQAWEDSLTPEMRDRLNSL